MGSFVLGDCSIQQDRFGYKPFNEEGLWHLLVDGYAIPFYRKPYRHGMEMLYWLGSYAYGWVMGLGRLHLEFRMEGNVAWLTFATKDGYKYGFCVEFNFLAGQYRLRSVDGSRVSGWMRLEQPDITGYKFKGYVLGNARFKDGSLGYYPSGRNGVGYLAVNGWGIPFQYTYVSDLMRRFWFGIKDMGFDTNYGNMLLEFAGKSQDIGYSCMVCCFRFFPMYLDNVGCSCEVIIDFDNGKYQVMNQVGKYVSDWIDLVPAR